MHTQKEQVDLVLVLVLGIYMNSFILSIHFCANIAAQTQSIELLAFDTIDLNSNYYS